MFCKNCGNQMNDEDMFCTNCGTPVGKIGAPVSTKKNIEDGQVRLSLKPNFSGGYQAILALGRGLVALCFVFCLSDAIYIGMYDFFEVTYGEALGSILLFSSIAVTIWEIIKLNFIKKQYSKLIYEFYKTKIKYVDGFINEEQKEVKYKFIREVTMSQNIFEKKFGIGKIRIYTNASGAVNTGDGHSQTGKNGIIIHCVKNVSENFKAVKALIDEADVDEN